MLLSAPKIASQSKLQLVRAYITCPSLLQLGFVSKRINFPLEENQRKGRHDCGLGRFRICLRMWKGYMKQNLKITIPEI